MRSGTIYAEIDFGVNDSISTMFRQYEPWLPARGKRALGETMAGEQSGARLDSLWYGG